MIVGLLTAHLYLQGIGSLKEKRSIVKAIVAQLRTNFNASVAEVDANDVHQRAVVGFALVGNDKALINSKIDKMFNRAEELGLAEVIDSQMELFTL